MRVSIGLGLIAFVGLFACTSGGDTSTPGASHRTPDSDNDNTSTSTEATEPPETPGAPGGGGSGGGSDDPSAPEAPPGPLLSGIAVTSIAVFQAVKVPVVADGTVVSDAARKAPVVAKRPGILRVYVTPGSGFKAGDVTAELRLVSGDKHFPVIRETKKISGPSKEDDPTTTFNLEVPAESLPLGTTYQVMLTGKGGDPAPSGKSDARFPRDGSFQALGAELSGTLRVVVVPVKYDADGSGRTPDMTDAQIARYKKRLMAWYPATEIDITVHKPLPWTTKIANNGTGFQNILRGIAELRQQDEVGSDVYYYGLLQPSANWGSYCGGGCVTGLSAIVGDAKNAALRASVGIGFTGEQSAETMGHELGHAHGRDHAPCGGAQGADPQFPYQGAAIGVWGYDIFEKAFIAPSKGRDMMGYCPNQWVSDYTYNALFNRIAAISTAKNTWSGGTAKPAPRTRYRIAMVDGSGSLNWDGGLAVDEKMTGGDVHRARFVDAAGASLANRDAHFYPFDHLPGGFLFVPEENALSWTKVEIDGYEQKLAR